jgi:thymidylate kinase
VLKRGKLIVMEGPDGVGKTTLAQALTERLRSVGICCERLSFPGHEEGTLGRLIYDFHHNPLYFGVHSVSPSSLQLLHVAAHIDMIEKTIIPTLAKGNYVVLDRFWWSTWVYGKNAGIKQPILEAMLKVEFEYWNEISPDVVFLFRSASSFREEVSADEWRQLSGSYYELANEQRQYYPVSLVENNADIENSLRQISEMIATLDENITIDEIPDVDSQSRESLPQVTTEQLSLTFTPEVSDRAVCRTPSTFTVITDLSPAKPSEVYDTYWRFAARRQAIFFNRLEGKPLPWTDDPILRRYKFTNAYRASDRVSQYLIKQVIYHGDQSVDEVFFRILLFKIFNRIETWKLLQEKLGEVCYAEYSFELYDTLLTQAMSEGHTIFSAAYIMPSGGTSFGHARKHSNFLRLLETMIQDEVPRRITDMHSMRQVFELLRSYPMIGDFLAYQFTIDINYSELTNFSEMEFVVPGPGAKDGIRKCFFSLGGLSEADVIRLVAERQDKEFARLGLDFRSLWGRPLQLIDCQNVFCEVDKYARMAHPHIKGISNRKRIKQAYQGNHESIAYWYPPKWGINHFIQGDRNDTSFRE